MGRERATLRMAAVVVVGGGGGGGGARAREERIACRERLRVGVGCGLKRAVASS